MFDKLIESEPEGADFKTRRNYFMVSSLVVGILFTTAVVISIFAADFGLGSSSFELTEMIAPVDMAAVEPETPHPRPPASASRSQVQMPTRQVNIARIDEFPIVPTTISVVPNTQLSRPPGDFKIDRLDSDPVILGGSGRENTDPGPGTVGLTTTPQIIDAVKDPEPPPTIKDPPHKKKVSGGVLNGKATSLPKPVYSAAARSVGAKGQVNVQVTIDENGKVILANAMGGHPLLRNAAEQAARNARFSPTYLSDVAVKVTGVIFYNFTL